MGQLHLAVLGSPEIIHDGNRLRFPLRKAQALLLYLAVEGGVHSRGKLAAFLWPDSEPHDARSALRNTLTMLRSLLAHPHASPPLSDHLLSQRDLIGLDPQAPFSLDQNSVLHAHRRAQMFAAAPPAEQRASFVAELQQALALVRGPFLDGFWLGEEAPFDEWIEQQKKQWQVRLPLLFDRLSSWHEAAGESEQAKFVLTHWLTLDALNEEAYRRLMRAYLVMGDPGGALQVYTTCRTRLAEELRVKPALETVALAQQIHAMRARLPARASMVTPASEPPSEIMSPLVGRSSPFSQIVSRYQQVRQGQTQAVIIEGDPGMGKTRLATEFVAWAQAQGAEVLIGHAMETGGRIPYQPLVEAMRVRLEEENAPEDLLEDVWLAELSRLLPEVRIRYPDLPVPLQDEMMVRVRLFEAVARLLEALSQRGPLVLFLDDLQWIDAASADMLIYLVRYWQEHHTRLLLLGTARSDWQAINPTLVSGLSDLRRYLPSTQVNLQGLSQTETQQLLDVMIDDAVFSTKRKKGQLEHAHSLPVGLETLAEPRRALTTLGHFLFEQTGGHPLILMETLKLLRDRQWLVPRQAADGTWRFTLIVEMAMALTEEQARHELVPPSVRAMVLTGLARLTSGARELVRASAILGDQATWKLLRQMTEPEEQVGFEAIEEAIKRGLLREQEAGRGRASRYSFVHELVRDIVYTELGEAQRQFLHQRALRLLSTEGAKAAELTYHALAAGEMEATYHYSVQAGDEALAVFAVEEALWHYEQARALFQKQIQGRMLKTFEKKSLPPFPAEDIASRIPMDQTRFPQLEHLYVSLELIYTYRNAEEQAQEVYEELLAFARQQQLPALVSMTLNRMVIRLIQRSLDRPHAFMLLKEAMHMAEISQDQRVLAETQWNQAQILSIVGENLMRSLLHAKQALDLAQSISDKELEARSLSLQGTIHLWKGDFRGAIRLIEAAIVLYRALSPEQSAVRQLSLPSFVLGFSLTQRLTVRATEALCWGRLALAQLHDGQVQQSVRSGHKAFAISKETRNVWSQADSSIFLALALLEAGAYEEALGITHQAIELVRLEPKQKLLSYILHSTLGYVYQAMQQWKEAQAAFEEGEIGLGAGELGQTYIPLLSRLCMNAALTEQWEMAYRYAREAIALREYHNAPLMPMDFCQQYETEALLRGGDEQQAREAVQRLGEHLGPNLRFRITYLRSLAVLATWEGQREQAIGYLCEAAQLAEELELPGEQWQIHTTLGRVYDASGLQAQAHIAFDKAAALLHDLAEGIGNESLRASFLTTPSIQHVL